MIFYSETMGFLHGLVSNTVTHVIMYFLISFFHFFSWFCFSKYTLIRSSPESRVPKWALDSGWLFIGIEFRFLLVSTYSEMSILFLEPILRDTHWSLDQLKGSYFGLFTNFFTFVFKLTLLLFRLREKTLEHTFWLIYSRIYSEQISF